MKIPDEYKKYNYFTEDDLNKAVALRKKGFSYRQIGKKLLFSHSVIMYHICEGQIEKARNRSKLVSKQIILKAVKNYQKRFEEITGLNYSTQYDREHKQVRNLKKRNAYRIKVGLPILDN